MACYWDDYTMFSNVYGMFLGMSIKLIFNFCFYILYAFYVLVLLLLLLIFNFNVFLIFICFLHVVGDTVNLVICHV